MSEDNKNIYKRDETDFDSNNELIVREEIATDNQLLAIIVRGGFDEPGIQFFTPNNLSQQLASMSYRAGRVIPAHTHNPVTREVTYTQETLFIRKGKVRVDFFTDARKYVTSRILCAGDVILLVSGGHGFEILEELNMVEVKQGPYAGDADKTRFEPELPSQLRFD
jgi:hypothetical protein